MDIEFHFYQTYLIAARAGFDPKTAHLIAYSAQFVDDNDTIYEVCHNNDPVYDISNKREESHYRNYISQTKNILKPGYELVRIYPLFHFIPGDSFHPGAWRKDGAMHWLNTTPNSDNARAIMDAALKVGTPYRIGIAAHSYVDTWAHQNFVGVFDDFNSMDTVLGLVAPNVGHADAGYQPDEVRLVWEDRRLVAPRISNNDRFESAAQHLFWKLADHVAKERGQTKAYHVPDELIEDLKWATYSVKLSRSQRIDRYRALSLRDAYLHDPPSKRYDYGFSVKQLREWTLDQKDYDECEWFNDAVRTRPWWEIFSPRCTWKHKSPYVRTHWFWFQEAVKGHQNTAWSILSRNNLMGLEIANW